MRQIERGQKYGRLQIIEKVSVPGANNAMWRCMCDCGNTTIAAAANIGRSTLSCGCIAKETAAALLKGNKHTQTHGLTGTPEYRSWQLMKRRCYNPNDEKYPLYGGRGIIVCERWRDSFENFLSDMGPKPLKSHSIGRIDNNSDYSPQNCRWETPTQQARNTSRNVFIEIDGTTRCISEWCEYFGVRRDKIHEMTRIRNGKKARFATAEAAIRHIYRERHSA